MIKSGAQGGDYALWSASAEGFGELVKTPEANIIKLPNISASVPQLKTAIAELQEQGYPLPDYPEDPSDDEQREIRTRYDRVKGSAVNPVLRQGNSDRRASEAVKAYARKHPHSMGPWSQQSRSHVSTMSDGDFRSTERSVTVNDETAGLIANGRAVNLPDFSAARQVKVFLGQEKLIAIASRIAGTLFQPKVVLRGGL